MVELVPLLLQVVLGVLVASVLLLRCSRVGAAWWVRGRCCLHQGLLVGVVMVLKGVQGAVGVPVLLVRMLLEAVWRCGR